MSMSSGPLKCVSVMAAVTGGALVVLCYQKITAYLASRNLQLRLEEKCKEWPRNVVILHGMRRGKLTPNPSPFVLKLETFLRMHDIPYLFDCEFPKGDKQKMPWITLNEEHYTDSQLIINFLSEKYKVKSPVTDKALSGAATLARIVMDEHFFWALILWRYVYFNALEELETIFNLNDAELRAFQKITYSKYKSVTWYQGIGRHTPEEVTALMNEDLRAVSGLLGDKQFLTGDEPCTEDCAIFGMLAQIIWSDVKSPYTKLIRDELPNLRDYCERMKQRYWPDWDSLIKEASIFKLD